jgi:hypothetical protein
VYIYICMFVYTYISHKWSCIIQKEGQRKKKDSINQLSGTHNKQAPFRDELLQIAILSLSLAPFALAPFVRLDASLQPASFCLVMCTCCVNLHGNVRILCNGDALVLCKFAL